MKLKNVLPVILKLFLILSIAAGFIYGFLLLFSVFKSGYGYQFDNDELHHANLVYLYTHGYVPYRDVYSTFYTPFFEWLLAPAFLLFGFTFKTIVFARFIMILLLGIRIIAMYSFIRTVWSRRAALFAIPLFLLDPFLAYSGMQIRTDNLMMTVFTVGLAALAHGYTRRSVIWKNIAALILGTSLVVFIKVLPALMVIALVVAYAEIKNKHVKQLVSMAVTALVPVFLFIVWGAVTGALYEMWMQLVVEARASYSPEVFRYPVWYGSYNKPDNAWIYGVMGQPVTWVYVWIYPLLGAAGWFGAIQNIFTKKERLTHLPMQIMMILLFVVQFIVIFKVPSVFLQHYLPLNWLFALFGAVALDSLLTMMSGFPYLYYPAAAFYVFLFLSLARPSIAYNYSRATITNPALESAVAARWAQIPADEPLFPGFLFRPSVYPVPYGHFIGNVPPAVIARLPSIPAILEKSRLKHLILDEYTFGFLPAPVQDYITTHYTRVPGDDYLMERR